MTEVSNPKLSACLDRLEQVVNHVSRRLHSKMDQQLVEGLTASQFGVLMCILRRGRVSVSEVAGNLGVSLSAITALVDRLCRAGYVRRRRDENDRRVVWLELTPRGRDVVHSCLNTRRRVMEKYLGQLPEEDLEQLLRIYEKLLSILERDEPGAAGERRGQPGSVEQQGPAGASASGGDVCAPGKRQPDS